MDLKHLQQRLGPENPKAAAKAAEMLRLSLVKVPPGTLRKGEVCRQAICFELACSTMRCPLDHKAVVRLSGATDKVYTQSMVLMQKLLGVKPLVTVRELCIQFGCVRLEAASLRALALFKERFLAKLPPAARAAADFSRPTFTAAAFYLSARKAALRVDKAALLQRHCISSGEFADSTKAMLDLCSDILGTTSTKRQPKHRQADHTGPRGEDGTSSAEEGSDGEGAVHQQPAGKRQKHKEYEAFKENVMKSRPKQLTLDKLKQATLSFGKQ